MLPVFSVILEYHMDGRNSSDRAMVRPQSLYCMCILHSCHFKANPNTSIFEPYQLQLVTEHLFRSQSTDAKLIQGDRINVFHGF